MQNKESIVRSEVRTIAPNVSDNHLFEIAKKCGLINEHTAEDMACAIVGYAQTVLNDISVQEAFFLANGAGFERMQLSDKVIAQATNACYQMLDKGAYISEEVIKLQSAVQKVTEYDSGLTAQNLPCPLCKSVFTCNHTPLQRSQEVIRQLGEYPEGFDASCGLPAWLLRAANAAMCDVTGNRHWDVMAVATHMRSIFRPLIEVKEEPKLKISDLAKMDQRSCYCGEEISLQSVSGGHAPEGLYGRVTLRIGSHYVDYVRKPEILTFDEFVEFGKTACSHLNDGMPWSFSYKGYPVTHESDTVYLISQLSAPVLRFAQGDLLVTAIDGSLSVLPAGQIPEEGGWFVPRKMVNHLVEKSLNDLIQRAKACSVCDVDLRENGKNVRFEADWIKYMVPVSTSPVLLVLRKGPKIVMAENNEPKQPG